MTSDLHHLAAAYAVDALDPDERVRFEAHLVDCDMCRQEVAEFTATAATLADAVAVAPPPAVRGDVLRRIGETRQAAPHLSGRDELAARRARRVPWRATLAAAAVLALVAVGAVLVAGRAQTDRVDDVIAAADAVVTRLDGDPGSIRVVWSATRDQVAVFGNGLPDPGRDRVYELWAITGGVPTPAGLFVPEGSTVRTVIDVDAVDQVDVEAWGVTIEPAGGSPAPTGEIIHFAETT
jgi:anti-sigma-K factor RskA